MDCILFVNMVKIFSIVEGGSSCRVYELVFISRSHQTCVSLLEIAERGLALCIVVSRSVPFFYFFCTDLAILRPVPVVLVLVWQQCCNCFGRLTKSPRLDSGSFSRSSEDLGGSDKSGVVPLNKPLQISSFDDMENRGSTSRQQRLSSTSSASHRVPETQASAESDAISAYENHAFRLWTETRRQWVGTREKHRPAEHREPVISWSTTYEDLLGTNRPFAKPVPLPEMVEFLVDVWEQEGLFE